jgi:hypothetical protein
MAKAVKKKTPKKRASTYGPKLAINGTFEDVIGLSVKNIKPLVASNTKK